jgi:hypothetical protein
MGNQSDNELVLGPLVWFGLDLVVGALGFGHAAITHNGFALSGLEN